MKEIGEKLKEARLEMGISIEEAAEDLKLRPSQLENIEEGNQSAFKDIFYLKYFIRDYAKYLGLDADEMVEIAIKSGTDTSIKVVTAGTLQVAIRKGIISFIPKMTIPYIFFNSLFFTHTT